MEDVSSANIFHRSYRGRTSKHFWKWRPIDRNDRAKIIFLAERLNANTRKPGQHGGCLKDSGLAVLRALLFHFLDCRSGRLDPALETIARAVGHSKTTVVAALGRLKAAGFLNWTQRVVVVKKDGQSVPTQVTNAYQIGASKDAAGFMPSGWKQREFNYWSESTDPYFYKTPTTPTDEPLRTALMRLAKAAGWTKERLEEFGLDF